MESSSSSRLTAPAERLLAKSRRCWKGRALESWEPFSAKEHFRFQSRFIDVYKRIDLTATHCGKRNRKGDGTQWAVAMGARR
jgi:hypothetical protein